MLLMTLGLGCLSMMDGFAKMLGAEYPVWQLTFMRYLMGLVAALPLLLLARPERPTLAMVRANMLRGVMLLLAAWCFFQAVQFLPLALATTLFATAPLTIIVLGAIFLGEPITRRALGAIAIGMVGVLVICGGSLDLTQLGGATDGMVKGFVLAFGATILYAAAVIMIRARAQHDAKVNIVFFQTLSAVLVSLPFGIGAWQPVATDDWPAFLMLGILGTGGFLLISTALSRAPVATLAPFEYTAFLWASLWGFLFFSEIPQWTTLAGAILIVVAGLIVLSKKEPEPADADEAPPV